MIICMQSTIKIITLLMHKGVLDMFRGKVKKKSMLTVS